MSHQDTAYRDVEVEYTGATVASVLAADRRSFSVTSVCPTCMGTMTRTVSRGLPFGSKGLWREKARPAPDVPDHVTMVCACGYPHPNRPADSTETGCGTAWKQPLG